MVKSFQLLGVKEKCSVQRAQQQHQQLHQLIQQSDHVPEPLLNLIDKALERIEQGKGSDSLFGVDEKLMLKIVAMHQKVNSLEQQNYVLRNQLRHQESRELIEDHDLHRPTQFKWGLLAAFVLFGLVFVLTNSGVLRNPYLPDNEPLIAKQLDSSYTSNLGNISTIRWSHMTFKGSGYLAIRNETGSLLVRECVGTWYHLIPTERASSGVWLEAKLVGQYQKFLIYNIDRPATRGKKLLSNDEEFSSQGLSEISHMGCP
ncbi:hypothetical protein QWZ04_12525 [Vibrio tapetis subsp. quintayensis]|uniref:hypothetical protein n=1 Tax=Vibrio tapetis TaxID=52443 RepID=UPI0025B309A9|nr:hypothetical protein [Vibrio tapetis]MDN3681147.1 hypothetical protein [Vibrio tapetis subsp. quintayensis]